MKNILSISIIFFLLTSTVSSQAQIRRTPTTVRPATNTETVDPNKINQQVPQPNLQNLQKAIEYFSRLKVGTPTQKQGEQELIVVDQNFPALNTTKVTVVGKATTQGEICVTENLAIDVNAREFSYISESPESWVKPGHIFTAQSFISGQPTTVVLPRNPVNLAIDLRGVTNTVFQVQNPEQNSQLLQAENTLISQNATPPAANFSFSFHKIHSLDEMEFKLTGKFRGALGTFSAKFGLNTGTQQEYHYYMLEFQQNMFSIQVDGLTPNNVFKQPVSDMSGYVYINKVDYGRKGLIIFKSTRTLDELGVNVSANYNGLINSGSASAAYNSLSKKNEVEVLARFYGGDSPSAIQSMENTVERGVPDLFTYLRSQPNNHRLAKPIGYSLMNMNNQVVGQKSKRAQTVRTCTDVPLAQVYKLKVTLTDIQCINGRDGGGDNPDDYAIQQYIVYNALGKDKECVSRNINKFPARQLGPVQVPNVKNILISGDQNNQIHVRQNGDVRQRNRNMINNSLVFDITLNELNDASATFKIFTWFKEYSTTTFGSNDDKVLMNNDPISVKIKDVVEILLGLRNLNANTDFHDTTIGRGIKFHNFGAGNMHLANIQNITPLVLEGPIRVGSPGQKAAVWVQFELL
jgi:thiol-activated cytolysin